jgi:multidrug resistance efflux pump
VFLAELELKEAQMIFERCEVKAPISGQVADLKYHSGSLVSNSQALCEILSTNQLILRVKVLESDIPQISLGQTAEVYPITSTTVALAGR